MPRAIGANARLLMIPEASYGTAPGGNWRRMPFLSCNLGAEQPLLDAMLVAIATAITADPMLGGAVEWAQPGSADIEDVEFEGAASARAASLPVALFFTATGSPLA